MALYLDHPAGLYMALFQSRSRDIAVGIATGYGLDGRGVGVRVPLGSRMFSSPRGPDRSGGPPSLLSNGFFPRA
jgi:hypothetical protein